MSEQQSHLVSVIQSLLNSDVSFSDIILESGAPIMLKTARGWVTADLSYIPTMDEIGKFLETADVSWRDSIVLHAINKPIDIYPWRLRVNAYLASGGQKLMASIRRIPENPPALHQIGLPASVRLLLESAGGIILVSGATGAGKTTTMASMIEMLNEARRAHIITIEDPIEYVFKRKESIFSQREIGVDCETFADGVRDAMRQRPDIIVIGEIRDRATAEQALLAGESGHLVIGTMHARSACGTIARLMGFFSADEQAAKLQSLSASLLGIINQWLIPKKNSNEYALAVDLLINNKQQYSKILGDMDKVQALLNDREDGLSLSLGDSLLKLINDTVIDVSDAGKVAAGNAILYNKVRKVQKAP